MTDVGVCTIIRGRLNHLANQLQGLAHQQRPADRIAVAWMGGPDPASVIDASGLQVEVTRVHDDRTPLPLSRARNEAREAVGDVGTLIFLDVDVIPSRSLVADYVERLARDPAVWSGHVGYLPDGATDGGWDEDSLRRLAEAHPARPRPEGDQDLPGPELFWSLSFALPSAAYDALGGFDENFVGYGAEDTDFALRASRHGLGLRRTGAAEGWHQHHPGGPAPVIHLVDIIGNARTFHRRWGRWPMEGWLQTFARDGLITWDLDADEVTLTPVGRSAWATATGRPAV